MRNPENCGYPDGVMHAHVDNCHRAGIEVGIARGRELERAEISAASESGPTAEIALTEETAIRAGLITSCREELDDGRCDMPAEFVLWGKLLPPDALGPRCYGHAVDHTSHAMPGRSDQWAVVDLRPIVRPSTPPGASA